MKPEFQAALEYTFRSYFLSFPDGKCDAAKRWYPNEEERRPCCDRIRKPSRRWNKSLFEHCRTLEHCAKRYSANKRKAKQLVNILKHIPFELFYIVKKENCVEPETFIECLARNASLLGYEGIVAAKQLATLLGINRIDWDSELILAILAERGDRNDTR